MDYFRILNLKKEPFSNSPEPEFFFQSSQHLGCLQKLELGIRLRRGLNVVIGDVGTGKTTLCRQLILRFAGTEEDRSQVETHLIMDPAFSTPLEFLTSVAVTFGMPPANSSEWQYKENIKNYLFKRGVDEGKVIVLIIDEGQKLPQFCLEILREFLNYETNTNKLLQIVIFAQAEFVQTLKGYASFADRINLYYLLKPLNFGETKKLIRYRLAKASEGEGTPPIFTYPALWAVYWATKGYPRKIITLCHQAMLTLIIQNRSKAGYLLVRSCARRMTPLQFGKALRWAVPTFLLVLFAVLIAALVKPGVWQTFFPAGVASLKDASKPIVTASLAPANAPDAVRSPETIALPQTNNDRVAVKQKIKENMPDLLGNLTIQRRDTVIGISRRVYGEPGADRLQAILRVNPQIRNIDFIRADDVIKIPAHPVSLTPSVKSEGTFLAQVDRTDNINGAYRSLTDYPKYLPPVRLLPYWNKREGLVFATILRERFPDEAASRNAVALLPSTVARNVKVINTWEADTVFFSD